MEEQTFRSRLSLLVQKSRKAVRLYNNVGSMSELGGSELTGVQVHEWKSVNAQLLRRLSSALEITSGRRLVAEVYSVRDGFHQDWRRAENDLVGKQHELVSSAQHGDFIRCSTLSSELVVLKARMQAAQAAHHELEMLLKRTRAAEHEAPSRAAPEAAEPSTDTRNRFERRRDERVLSTLGLRELDDDRWFGGVPLSETPEPQQGGKQAQGEAAASAGAPDAEGEGDRGLAKVIPLAVLPFSRR